jgi:hypothetical protein
MVSTVRPQQERERNGVVQTGRQKESGMVCMNDLCFVPETMPKETAEEWIRQFDPVDEFGSFSQQLNVRTTSQSFIARHK